MANDGAYRDALAAAHARIEELEQALGERRRVDAHAARLAALERERERLVVVAAGVSTDGIPSTIVKLGVIGAITASVAALTGGYVVAVLVLAICVAVTTAWSSLNYATRREAAEHLKAFDAKIARVTRELTDGRDGRE